MNYQQKYLKYKQKYIGLKNITGGGTTVHLDDDDSSDEWNTRDDAADWTTNGWCDDERIDCWWKQQDCGDNSPKWGVVEKCGPFNEAKDNNGKVIKSKKDVMLDRCRRDHQTNYKFYGLEHHS